MRTPTWESSAGALVALLNGTTAARQADLVTITLTTGVVLRYTSHGEPLTVNGQTFLSAGSTPPAPGVQRGRTRCTVGVTVDTMALTLLCDAATLFPGSSQTMQAAARTGVFLRAEVTVEKAFSGPDGAFTPVGTIALFSGRVGPAKPTRSGVQLEVLSHTELLDVMVPADVYQAGCRNNLFDLNCGVSRSAHTANITATVASNAQRTTFQATIPTGTAGSMAVAAYHTLGVITGTGGAVAGVRRTVKTVAPAGGTTYTVEVTPPWPADIAVGQTFTITAGCDRTRQTCSGRFSNLLRFRGEPHIPVPETAG